MIQIKFRDIDPDTGLISQEKTIATCETTDQSKWIIEALTKHSDEPNRSFFGVLLEAPVTNSPTATTFIQEVKRAITKNKPVEDPKKKADEIDAEMRRQAELKAALAKTPPVASTRTKGPPANNGYVPYDQFKFE
jgi:hypothetical protein